MVKMQLKRAGYVIVIQLKTITKTDSKREECEELEETYGGRLHWTNVERKKIIEGGL